jgi:uncharacterized protein YdaU (DUF1376 family)
MSKSPAFQLYAADFYMGTDEMTAAQVGGYIRLLCKQWDKNYLPFDKKVLKKWTELSNKDLDIVLEKFVKNEHGYINERLEQERQKQEQYRLSRSEAGKIGNQKRWKDVSHSDGKSIADDSQNHRSSSSSSSSSSNSIKEKEIDKEKIEVQFPDNFTDDHKKLWFEYEQTRESIPKPAYSQATRQLALNEFVSSASCDPKKYTEGLKASIQGAWTSPKWYPPKQNKYAPEQPTKSSYDRKFKGYE